MGGAGGSETRGWRGKSGEGTRAAAGLRPRSTDTRVANEHNGRRSSGAAVAWPCARVGRAGCDGGRRKAPAQHSSRRRRGSKPAPRTQAQASQHIQYHTPTLVLRPALPRGRREPPVAACSSAPPPPSAAACRAAARRLDGRGACVKQRGAVRRANAAALVSTTPGSAPDTCASEKNASQPSAKLQHANA